MRTFNNLYTIGLFPEIPQTIKIIRMTDNLTVDNLTIKLVFKVSLFFPELLQMNSELFPLYYSLVAILGTSSRSLL